MTKIAILSDVPKKGTSNPLAGSYGYVISNAIEQASDYNLKAFALYAEFPGHVPTGNPKGKGKNKVFFDWQGLKESPHVKDLEEQLDAFQPDIIIGLGNFVLKYLKDNPDPLDKERGSHFWDFKGRLCLVTHHPRETFLRFYLTYILQHDILKACDLAKKSESELRPNYNINFLPTYEQVLEKLNLFIRTKPLLAVDIETHYKCGKPELEGRMSCLGIAWSERDAIVIPFVSDKDGSKPYWRLEEEIEIRKLLAECLRACAMIGHNALHFDHAMLLSREGIQANFIEDSMAMQWSLYPEFPKSLAFCSSLYTNNPYWKDQLKKATSRERWREFEYNGRDCIVTYQVYKAMKKEFGEREVSIHEHYRFNMRASRAYQYMSFMGCHIDQKKLSDRKEELQDTIEKAQVGVYL